MLGEVDTTCSQIGGVFCAALRRGRHPNRHPPRNRTAGVASEICGGGLTRLTHPHHDEGQVRSPARSHSTHGVGVLAPIFPFAREKSTERLWKWSSNLSQLQFKPPPVRQLSWAKEIFWSMYLLLWSLQLRLFDGAHDVLTQDRRPFSGSVAPNLRTSGSSCARTDTARARGHV
jgi:hypothetical protein